MPHFIAAPGFPDLLRVGSVFQHFPTRPYYGIDTWLFLAVLLSGLRTSLRDGVGNRPSP